MKKIIAILIVFIIAFSGVVFGKKVVFRKLGKRNFKIFIKKCKREGRVGKYRIKRALKAYQKYIKKYKCLECRRAKKRYQKKTVRNYKTLRRYCRRTTNRMLRKRRSSY